MFAQFDPAENIPQVEFPRGAIGPNCSFKRDLILDLLIDVDHRLQYIDRQFGRVTLTDQKQVMGAKLLYVNLDGIAVCSAQTMIGSIGNTLLL
jgi:hypothetical protein